MASSPLNIRQAAEVHLRTKRPRQGPEEKLLLIDCDAGTDDAWAIFMALAAHKASATTGVKIIGFTTTCGNTSVENVSVNVTRVLQTVQQNGIPIYQGMSEYLMRPFAHSEDPPYHGEDGFGDADLPVIPPRLENEHAVDAIIRLSEEFKGKLTIVALGPLTNLAMAVKLKPEIKNYIKGISILGGNMDALGNITAAAEFNFYVDAEAAAITVSSYNPCPITILPWEICLTASSTYAFRMETLNLNTQQMQLLNAIEAKNLEGKPESWITPDAVVMACVIDPTVLLTKRKYFAVVEVSGKETRGMLVVDKNESKNSTPNVELITSVDAKKYESLLLWTAGGPAPAPAAPNTPSL